MNSSIRRAILALVISTYCTELLAKVAPDYIKVCTGLKSDCLKEKIQNVIPHFVKGIPSIGLNSIDPMHFDYIKFDFPGGLKIEFLRGNLTGPGKCIVERTKYENRVLDFTINCNLLLKGKYKATGKLMLFTLDGDGDAKIKARNVEIQSKIYFEDKVRDGIEYHVVKDLKIEYHFRDRLSFDLSNLFKGNPELSKTILEFLNENWKEVLDEFGKPIIDTVLRVGFDTVKRFFRLIPKEELIA